MGLNRFVHSHVRPSAPHRQGAGPRRSGRSASGSRATRRGPEQAKAWVTYLARSSYMLQQGRFVADVLYFYGEDSNITALFDDKAPAMPAGYNFDYVNADALRASAVSERMGSSPTPSGMRYRVLALDPHSRHMSLPVLRKIRDLVAAGAVVVGPKPTGTPSLSDDDAAFNGWPTSSGERAAGAWRAQGGQGHRAGRRKPGRRPDAACTWRRTSSTRSRRPTRSCCSCTGRSPTATLYFVNNRNDRDEDVDATFRVTGKEAELWHADTGLREPAIVPDRERTHDRAAAPRAVGCGIRRVPKARGHARRRARCRPSIETPLATVDGAWEVAVPAGPRRSGSRHASTRLGSWSDERRRRREVLLGHRHLHQDDRGRARLVRAGSELWLDLGDVQNLAEVSVNGTAARRRVEEALPRGRDGSAVKPGANSARSQGDEPLGQSNDRRPPAGSADAVHVYRPVFYKADSPLLPSGLLGPVRVLRKD